MKAQGEDAHILIVDDDDRIRTLLKRFLIERGFRASSAPDAAKALALLKSMEFDLLILDVMMPGMNGFELTEAVRSKGQTPILLLTARGEPADRIKGLSLGADDYLPKPFEPEELVLRINAILRRARPARAAHGKVRFGGWTYDIGKELLSRGETRVRLTGGEAALLNALAAQPGTPVSRLALSERAGGGERAVDVQVTRLRRKIEDDPRDPVHLQTVRGEGYKLIADAVFDE
ncbi:MAG: response regulator transcription factor [Maricaulaceae bacterium]|nr:response regulator transcription factor [Maricaulaceae bacterium]